MGGGGNKIPASQIALVELTPPTARSQSSKVYRALLQEGQKGFLFRGLKEAQKGGNSQIRVDNDTPLYAQQAKKDLDQLSFSLRSKFGGSNKLRVKYVLHNQKLKLRIRFRGGDGSTAWLPPEDSKCDKFLDIPLLFRATEKPPLIPTCREFYKKIIADQE